MLVARRRSDDPTVALFARSRGLGDRIGRRVRRWRIERQHARYQRTRPDWPERFSDDRSWYDVGQAPQLGICDVVNLHWVAGFVDYREFFRGLDDHVPVVWTFHDMNVFTGGCHYDDRCGRFKRSCGACPQLGSRVEDDLSRRIWRRKRDFFQGLPPERLRIVTPSRWLARQVRYSTILGERFQVSVIPYGLDTDDFAPRDRNAAREALGIPRDARVVLFVAQVLNNRRKGFDLLVDALRDLQEIPDLFLVSLGTGRPALNGLIPHRHLGVVTQDRLLSLVYSAADVFVIPSIQDNLPATVLESLACGTPVLGFDAGGVPEMVRPRETGALARTGDVRALRSALVELLKNEELIREMAVTCRQLAVDEYALDVQARRYETLYHEMLSVRKSRSPETVTETPSANGTAPAARQESFRRA